MSTGDGGGVDRRYAHSVHGGLKVRLYTGDGRWWCWAGAGDDMGMGECGRERARVREAALQNKGWKAAALQKSSLLRTTASDLCMVRLSERSGTSHIVAIGGHRIHHA